MKKPKLNNKRIVIYSLILATIFLSAAPITRLFTNESILIGNDAYYNIRAAQFILDNGILKQDPLTQKNFLLNPYHLLLAETSRIMGIHFASILLPLILGIASIIIFSLILNNFIKEDAKKIIILMITIISPTFIYTFSTSNEYCLSIFLILLGFYLSIDKPIYSIPFFIILAFFNPINLIIAIPLLLIYSIQNKRLKYFYIIYIILPTIITSIIYNIYLKYNPFSTLNIFPKYILINSISDLGGIMGFGIFNILLAIVGLYIVWKIKKQILSYITLIFLILISFYITKLNMFLNFIMSIFTGFGLSTFIKMKYSLKIVKKLTILVLILGLLFSSLSYISRLSDAPPDKKILNSLEWLKSQPKGVVLSHPEKSFYIETIAKKQVFLNPISKQKLNTSNEIFYSRNLEKTKTLLKNNNIRYIWIDKEMKQGKVWTKEEQGLLFLFRNQKTFKNIYNLDNIEIWEFINNEK